MRISTTLLLITTFALAATADEPPDAIRGKAFLAGSDRPAARITLHFFGRGAPLTTVVTDAGGRFRCPIPPGLSFPAIRRRPGGTAVLDGDPGGGPVDLAADLSEADRPAGADAPPGGRRSRS